jgi:hypothetical protein
MDLLARLEPNTFVDEEPVGIAAVKASELPGPLVDDSWAYVPEPIWRRLLSLGDAYKLHFSQIAEPILDTVFNPKQCQSLCMELGFLRGVIADAAAHSAIDTIVSKAAIVSRDNSLCLVVSPP